MTRFRRPLSMLVLLTMISVMLAGCANFGFGPTTNFVTLPPPEIIDGTEHTATLHYTGQGESNDSQHLLVFSNDFELTYVQNRTVGVSANEKLDLLRLNRRGLMDGISWGTIEGFSYNTFDQYGADGRPTMQYVEMEADNTNILAILRDPANNYPYVIDKSRLHFYYIQQEPGQRARLFAVKYDERWKWGGAEVALGQYAIWTDISWVPAQYQEWGFWNAPGVGDQPTDTIAGALQQARNTLNSDTIKPQFEGFDRDGVREFLLDRQSGFDLMRDGQPYGSINLSYSNLFGTMPNTPAVSKGALSRIDWNLGGEDYALAIITPALSRDQNSLFVFCDDPGVCSQIQQRPQDSWPQLYRELRAGIPGVMLAVHAMGSTVPTTSSSVDSDGDVNTSVTGSNAGLKYSAFGRPTFQQVYEVKNLMEYLGWGGVRALGLHYPTSPGSGSGINYYIRMLLLSLAPEDKALLETGYGTEVIDVVGFPEPMDAVRAR